MVYRVSMWLLAIIWISSFSFAYAKPSEHKSEKQTLMDVYSESIGQSKKDMAKFIDDKLTEQQTYGYVKPYIPVIQQPVVQKVWIPDHKAEEDADVLVAGHWTYVMVEGPKWFIDTQVSSEKPEEIIVPSEPLKGIDKKGNS